MSDARERLIILYFNAVPGIDAVSAAVSDLPGVAAALLARTDEASRRADMWRRDPLQCLPTGRLALDLQTLKRPFLTARPCPGPLGASPTTARHAHQ